MVECLFGEDGVIQERGVFLSNADCARIDSLLWRAVVDEERRNGGISGRVRGIAEDIRAVGVEFRSAYGTGGFRDGPVGASYEASEWLTTPEAANILSVSESYVRRLLRRGELAGSRMGGKGTWIVDAGSVAVWKAEHLRKAG